MIQTFSGEEEIPPPPQVPAPPVPNNMKGENINDIDEGPLGNYLRATIF